MPNTAKGRVWRSTQTSPNAGTVRDLTTAFGTTPNNTTVAAFAAAGASGLQWSPNTGATTANPPASPATVVTGRAWRDTVAENAAEQVTYAAGTWTLRVLLNKTVMTINASVTVRVTAVVFQVDSSGAFIGEIGRVVFADTALPTVGAPVSATGGFTTGAVTVFAPGDKAQVEIYVQNVVAGTVTAAVAAYTVALVTDETNANSGTGFTAQPGYAVLYARTHAVTAAGAAAMGRQITAARAFAVTGGGTASMGRAVIAVRSFAVTGAGGVAKQLRASKSFAVTGSGVVALGPKAIKLVKAVTGIAVLAMNRVIGRVFAVTGTGAAVVTKVVVAVRKFAVTGTGVPALRLDIPQVALNRITVGGPTDWPLNAPTKTLAGVVRDSAGTPYVGATVQLVRESDNYVAATTTSAAGGAYSFSRGVDDPYTYRVIAYEDSGTPSQGVSGRGLVPV